MTIIYFIPAIYTKGNVSGKRTGRKGLWFKYFSLIYHFSFEAVRSFYKSIWMFIFDDAAVYSRTSIKITFYFTEIFNTDLF